MVKTIFLNVLLSWKIFHVRTIKKMNYHNLESICYQSKKPIQRKKETFTDGFKSSVQYRILSPNSQGYEYWDRFTNILSQSLFQ